MANVKVLDHSIPETDPLALRLKRTGLKFLGRVIVRAITTALAGKDPEAARILSLVIAWYRAKTQKEHAAGVGDVGGEFDVDYAGAKLDDLKALATVIKALPESTRPSGVRFWLGPGGAMLADREIPGVTQALSDQHRKDYGGPHFVGETITESAAGILANLLGGRLCDSPPAYLIEETRELTKAREPSDGWEAEP